MAAYLAASGDWDAVAGSMGLTPTQARNILARPRMRRALGQALGNMASPEMIVAGLVDQAFGADKVSEYWESGGEKRIDHKLRQDALLALAKLRGLLVDRLDVKGVSESEGSLDRLIAAELARVRGSLPGSSDVIDAEAVTPTDAVPTLDPAGLAPNDTPSD